MFSLFRPSRYTEISDHLLEIPDEEANPNEDPEKVLQINDELLINKDVSND